MQEVNNLPKENWNVRQREKRKEIENWKKMKRLMESMKE